MNKKRRRNKVRIPSEHLLKRKIGAFAKLEPGDDLYIAALKLIRESWENDNIENLTLGVSVMLLEWNKKFYQFGSFNFKALRELLEAEYGNLKRFVSQRIAEFDEEQERGYIITLFEKLNIATTIKMKRGKLRNNCVGPAKALHLLFPHFFPPWDEKIAKVYVPNFRYKTAEKYIEFMKKMKELVKETHDYGIFLRTDKTRLKLIDEYNFVITR